MLLHLSVNGPLLGWKLSLFWLCPTICALAISLCHWPMPKMVRKKNRHRNYSQPMRWANMHPRGLVLFLFGEGGGCWIFNIPIKFPLILQHVPQIPNLFPNMCWEHFNVSHILCPEFCFYNIYKQPKTRRLPYIYLRIIPSLIKCFCNAYHNRKEIKLWGSSQLINPKNVGDILAYMTRKIINYNIIWTIKFTFKVMFNITSFPHLASFLSVFSCPLWCYL
jgi:hypothetical protein